MFKIICQEEIFHSLASIYNIKRRKFVKLTSKMLKRLIREELRKNLKETWGGPGPSRPMDGQGSRGGLSYVQRPDELSMPKGGQPPSDLEQAYEYFLRELPEGEYAPSIEEFEQYYNEEGELNPPEDYNDWV